MDKLKFVLIEPDQLVRTVLALVLNKAGYSVAAEYAIFRQALSFLEANNDISVVIGEMSMTAEQSFIGEAKSFNPRLKVVILSSDNSLQAVQLAMAYGADGYLLKDCHCEELELAIKSVLKGTRYLHSRLSTAILENENFWKASLFRKNDQSIFNDRELEVLELVGQGMTNEQMSESLFLSKRTVEGHRQNLLTKSKCKNSAQLIRYAMRQGFLE